MRRQLVIIGLLGSAFFIPAGVIGYMNQPKLITFTSETHSVHPVDKPSSIAAEHSMVNNIIELPTIRIAASKTKVTKPTVTIETPVYCRDHQLYNGGGTIRYCDSEPPNVGK